MIRKIAVAALGIFFILAPFASARGGTGRLLIRRAANFGTEQFLRISIDGEKFKPIALGHDFEIFLPAGHHVITVEQSNNPWRTLPTRVPLNVETGRTYQFTAFLYQDHRVYLEPRDFVSFAPGGR